MEARRSRRMVAVDRAGIHLSRRGGIRGLNRREGGSRDLHRRSRVGGSKALRRHREVGSRVLRRRSRVGGSRARLRGRRREGILGRGIRGREGGIRGRDIVGDIRGWWLGGGG